MESEEHDKLRELKEMSILSLSHTSPDSFSDIIKIIKNFFGVYFDIKDEFTYGDMLDKMEQLGLGEDQKQAISQFIGKLSYILYKKPSSDSSDYAKVKQGFQEIIESLVPESSLPKPEIQEKQGLFSKLLHKQAEHEAQTKAVAAGAPMQALSEQQTGNAGADSQTKKEPQAGLAPPEPSSSERASPQQQEHKPKALQANLQKSRTERADAEQEKPKPQKTDQKTQGLQERYSGPQPLKAEGAIEARLKQLETEISKLAPKQAEFLEIELESIKGDYGLYLLDSSAVDKNTVLERLKKLSSRL
jgi:hypothetical protein